ncbi:MAG: hypothetical protein IGS03_15215 [Candidatus Sericytochromatia bacterium]|nr:hypothetical protein [Candidatus Sericytochromatia bacterium]
MSETFFYHFIQLNTFQKVHLKNTAESVADSAAGSSAAVLQANDQREGTRHAAFEFQQELHFPSPQAADPDALEVDTQVVLQVLDTLLAAEDSSASEL